MKKLLMLVILFSLAAAISGCATDMWNKNPLQSLTDKQSRWFENTGEHFRFNE